jgi:hypothetical protein
MQMLNQIKRLNSSGQIAVGTCGESALGKLLKQMKDLELAFQLA